MIETRHDQLRAWERRRETPPRIVDLATNVIEQRERIEASRFNHERRSEELAHLSESTAEALVSAYRQHVATLEAAAEVDEEHGAERLARADGRRLVDVIDVRRLESSSSPGELLDLVARADAVSDELGQEARAISIPRCRVLAMEEQRRNRLTGNGPAFRALAELTLAHGPVRVATRQTRQEALAHAIRQARETTLAVSALVGLEPLVRLSLVSSKQREERQIQTARMSIGPFFERPARERRH